MITIIGPGSLGVFFAVNLWKLFKKDVYVLDYKDDRAKKLNEKGLFLKKHGQVIQAFPKVTANPEHIGPQKFVLILVKAFQTKDILEPLSKICDQQTLVLTLQNGIGAADILKEVIAPENLALGITMHGVNKKDDGVVVHAGAGETIVGSFKKEKDKRLEHLALILTNSGIKTKVVGDIYPALWKKLLVNIGINPITALTGLKNGAILEFPELVAIQETCVKEAFEVMKKANIQIDMEIEDILKLVKKVCKDTSSNVSSMLQDRLKKRETEIDFINGAIVKKAQEYGINVSANLMILMLIKYFTKRLWQFDDDTFY